MLLQTEKAKRIAQAKMNGAETRVIRETPLHVIQPETPTLVRMESLPVRATVWVFWLLYPIFHPVLFAVSVIQFPAKSIEFLRVVLSGRVSEDEANDRSATCANCKDCHHLAKTTKAGVRIVAAFCGLCGCGYWILARIGFKKWLRAWECPRGRHNNTKYRIDEWIEFAKDNGYHAQAEEWKYAKAGHKRRKSCGG